MNFTAARGALERKLTFVCTKKRLQPALPGKGKAVLGKCMSGSLLGQMQERRVLIQAYSSCRLTHHRLVLE